MQSDQRFFLRIAIWLSAICFSCANFVSAQDGPTGEPPRVVAVRVVTESGSVLEQDPPHVPAQHSERFSMDTESESLRELFRSGRFADSHARSRHQTGGKREDAEVRQNLYINRVQI